MKYPLEDRNASEEIMVFVGLILIKQTLIPYNKDKTMTLIIEKAKINKEEKFKLSANKLSNLQLKRIYLCFGSHINIRNRFNIELENFTIAY